MKLNLPQTKLVGLTMKLDLEARNYKILCEKLDTYKNENIDENDERLYELLNEFQENHNKIVEIKKQLKEIENIKEEIKTYNYEDMFKNPKKEQITPANSSSETSMVKHEENLWEKIKSKIRKIFNSK